MDLALLVLRVVVGLLFIGHGSQKLFGWFGGGGRAGTAGFFGSIGLRPAPLMAVLAGLSEFTGGLLIASGLLTPLAALLIGAVMFTAIMSVHWPRVWNSEGGLEYPLVNLASLFAITTAGPGGWSLDALVGLPESWGVAWALGSLLLAFVGAGGVVLLGRQLEAEEAHDAAADLMVVTSRRSASAAEPVPAQSRPASMSGERARDSAEENASGRLAA
jgi:putative oxidoreductase